MDLIKVIIKCHLIAFMVTLCACTSAKFHITKDYKLKYRGINSFETKNNLVKTDQGPILSFDLLIASKENSDDIDRFLVLRWHPQLALFKKRFRFGRSLILIIDNVDK